MIGWIVSHRLDLIVGAVVLCLVIACLRNILAGKGKHACGSCASCSGSSCACGKGCPSCHAGTDDTGQEKT